MSTATAIRRARAFSAAQARYDYRQPPDYTAETLAESTGDAEDAATRDADSLADWLSGECMGAATMPWQPMHADAINCGTAATALLLALAFDSGQTHRVRVACLDELRTRYLATPAVQRFIDRSFAEAA